MPEEEGEDEADPDAHDPGSQHKHQQPEVGEGLHSAHQHSDHWTLVLEPELDINYHLDHGAELRHGPELAGEHLHPLGLLLQTLALVLGSRLNQVETMMILV